MPENRRNSDVGEVPQEKPKRLSRRWFLERAPATALTAALGSQKGDISSIISEEEASEDIAEYTQPLPERQEQPIEYQSGPLKGRKLGDLYTWYTGANGEVEENINVDFQYQLQEMWKRKEKVSGGNNVVELTGRILRWEHKEKDDEGQQEKITSLDYVTEAEKAIADVKTNLDWSKIAEIKRLNQEDLDLVIEISDSIDGRDLIAYCLTELMPSKEGRLNIDVLDFILQNAGKEYLESIPALYDPKTSFGPYQFTEYALYDTEREKRGASVINRALKKGKIPGSVSKLRGNNHHKAAFLFMVDNFANLVRSLRVMSVKRRNKDGTNSFMEVKRPNFKVLQNRLSEELKKNRDDLVIYAATAHHGPSVAIGIAHRWLGQGQGNQNYKNFARRIYRIYADKTEANLKALKNRYKKSGE